MDKISYYTKALEGKKKKKMFLESKAFSKVKYEWVVKLEI